MNFDDLVNEYSDLIADVLYENDLIDKELYLKCGNPKYISDLPGNLNTTDGDVLFERLGVIDDELNKREEILKRAEYRIGVKTRDSERLGRRIDKTMTTMDKSVESINSESDKVVKNISALEEKLGKVEFTDKDLGSKISKSLKDFKKIHNNLFDDDLSGENIKDYKKLVEDYGKAGDSLNNLLKTAYEGKFINKSDMNKSDISKNINRINKQIDKYEKNGGKISKDVQSIEDNQRDIDYIVSQSSNVSKEMDILLDNFEKTYNKYVDATETPKKIESPNPQMMINIGNKQGDNFTLLPNNYWKYMVD